MFVWRESFICVWYDSFLGVRSTHSYVWHDSFMCVWHDWFICATWLAHSCDMTHSSVIWLIRVWHDSFTCVTWLIHMCDVSHSCVWHDTFICVTWLIHTCNVSHSCVYHDSFRCVTRYPAMSHDSKMSLSKHANVSSHTCMCFITHMYVTHLNKSCHT